MTAKRKTFCDCPPGMERFSFANITVCHHPLFQDAVMSLVVTEDGEGECSELPTVNFPFFFYSFICASLTLKVFLFHYFSSFLLFRLYIINLLQCHKMPFHPEYLFNLVYTEHMNGLFFYQQESFRCLFECISQHYPSFSLKYNIFAFIIDGNLNFTTTNTCFALNYSNS